MGRTFAGVSAVSDEGVALALAPALTPHGLDVSPSFFHGFATEPQVLARGLVTLADITATRYFSYMPSSARDPVLTAHGDRLRAEVFSACNGVYGRFDVLSGALDGGEIRRGATNVDIGAATRAALSSLGRHELLHLDIGSEGLAASTPTTTVVERPVQMPDRWIRALGNVAELHSGLEPAFSADAAAARRFVAALPAATGAGRSGWVAPHRGDLRVGPRPTPGAVHISGLHRLSAVKRLLVHVRGMEVHGPAAGDAGPAAVVFLLPNGRLTIGLTDEPWRGHSGEGSLLVSLASAGALDHAELVGALLAFDPAIDVARLGLETGLDAAEVRSALAVLAASGRVGWDAVDGAYFHRELPDDPSRVDKDNPRLVRARRLLEDGAVRDLGGGDWHVGSDDEGYRIHRSDRGEQCACAWSLRHRASRGPCAHLLAVRMFEEQRL